MGMDVKECGFLLARVYELYECGILSREELDGLEMNWGNCDSGIQLVQRIAHREGVGEILAEGVKRAAERIGRGPTSTRCTPPRASPPTSTTSAANGAGWRASVCRTMAPT